MAETEGRRGALVAGAGGGQLNLSQQMEDVCMIISENKPRKENWRRMDSEKKMTSNPG